MTRRHEIRTSTVQAVADDYVGRPLDAATAAAFAQFLEASQRQLEALRQLQMKGSEPAMVFRPVEVRRHD
jgi:hypothetical protein